jgi:tetratricopeptide (TPR) repeat protein
MPPAPTLAAAPPPPAAGPATLWERVQRPSVLLRLAFALTLLAYLPTVTYDFVYDDHLQVAMNLWLTSGDGLKHIFTEQSWGFAEIELPARYYRPLYLVWLWAIRKLSDGAPGWFHLAAILSHIGVSWLAFLLARRLLRDERAAAFAALVFALHPAKVEAIAWIAGASEIVHAACFFAMFLAYLRWRDGAGSRWLALSAFCFGGALLAKETAVIGPGLIVVHWWMTARHGAGERGLSRPARLIAPYVVVGVAYWLVRLRVLGSAADLGAPLSLLKTAYTIPLAFCWYLKHLVWPVHLSLFYPEMIVRRPELARFFGPSAILLLIAVAYWRWARRSSEMKFMGAWFVATLLPAAGAILLLQPHDRYLYLPSFAFAVVLGRLESALKPRHALAAVLAFAVAAPATIAVEERHWDDDRRLFTRAVAIAPDVPEAAELLAGTYSGRDELPTAMKILRDAHERMPQDAALTYALAMVYRSAGDSRRAEALFRRTLQLSPEATVRGRALFQLGMIAQGGARYEEAESYFRQALAVSPHAPGFHRALAGALQAQGKRAEAEAEMAKEAATRRARGGYR